MTRSVIVLCLFCVLVQCYEQDVGDECKALSGKQGVCKLLKECPSAADLIRESNVRPTICGFRLRDPIVCCEPLLRPAVQKHGEKSQKYCSELYNPDKVGIIPFRVVFGGENAKAGEFPYMAALGFSNENKISFGCGGSLISPQHVLTAAHCLRSRELGDVQIVRLGDLNLNSKTDEAGPQEFTIKNKYKHPDFKAPVKYHDIAIIELDRPVNMTSFVKPACLPTVENFDSQYFTAAGWGRLEYGGETSSHLQKIYLEKVPNKKCNDFFKAESKTNKLSNGIVDNLQICAFKENGDTCQGDSGGPLETTHPEYKQGHVIVGVTSFGKACGIANSPGVYTRVSNYIDWIESVVWPQ